MLNLLSTRRSIRQYQPRSVEKEKVDQIVKAALLAPSGRGIYPQKFILVDDKELLEKFGAAREQGSAFLSGAPLAIVVLADSTATNVWIEDACISAAIIQLTAHSLGLGTCWVQIRERQQSAEKTSEEYLRELLGFPEEYRVECIIGIGYPDEEKPAKTDEDLDFERVRYNNYQKTY